MANTYSNTDIENLYKQCNNAEEDTISRICIGFLNDHHIRRENVPAFFAFCKDFLRYSNNKDNNTISRRMALIELQGHLKFDSATHINANLAFEELYETYIKEADYSAALECLFELGQYFHSAKDNIKALKVLFYAEKIGVKFSLQNQISYQGILHRIGYILWQLNKPNLSIIYLNKALQTGNGLRNDSMFAFNALGMNYQKLDSFSASLKCFTAASKLALADKNELFNTIVQGSMAVTLLQLGELDKAYDFSMQYKNVTLKYPLWENAVDAFNQLIKIDLLRNNIIHAKVLLDSLNGILINIKNDDFESQKKSKEVGWQYYEKIQNYKSSFSLYRQYVHYDSLLQDYGNKNKISELALNAEIRLYEQEMIGKERNLKWRKYFEKAIIVLLILFITIIAIWSYKKNNKSKKVSINNENINKQQAIEIEKLKKQLLEQLTIIQTHNDNYQYTITNNKEIKITEEQSVISEISHIADNSFTEVEFLKAFDLTKKNQWKEFKIMFCNLYPNYEQDIITKFGAFSSAELRLAMLLKLGLNNNEITKTLLITLDGVKKAKYRLFKKTEVNSSQEFNSLLG